MSAKAKSTEPSTDGPPCPGCHDPHDLRACADLRGADLLAAADLPMTAHKVRARALAKGGAA